MASIQTRRRGARFLVHTGPCRCACDRAGHALCRHYPKARQAEISELATSNASQDATSSRYAVMWRDVRPTNFCRTFRLQLNPIWQCFHADLPVGPLLLDAQSAIFDTIAI